MKPHYERIEDCVECRWPAFRWQMDAAGICSRCLGRGLRMHGPLTLEEHNRRAEVEQRRKKRHDAAERQRRADSIREERVRLVKKEAWGRYYEQAAAQADDARQAVTEWLRSAGHWADASASCVNLATMEARPKHYFALAGERMDAACRAQKHAAELFRTMSEQVPRGRPGLTLIDGGKASSATAGTPEP